MFRVPEKYRIVKHCVAQLCSDASMGNKGAFDIPFDKDIKAFVIAAEGEGWEHVSVHMIKHGKPCTPSWSDMCRIKNLFWSAEDCVVQYHPPKSDYVNTYKHCLHLWRPIGVEIPLPPIALV